MVANKDYMVKQNRHIAEDNLAKEPQIIEKREKIVDLSTQGKDLCLSVQTKLEELS